jgi:quercetin dioxygenase-like cupin family protein
VVTGLTSGGRSIILSDGPVPETAQAESPGQAHASELWIQRQLPPHRTDPPDPLSGYTIQAWPPPGGLLARIVTWEPGYVSEFHRSATLDIIFVITGQLQLQLEEGATTLGPGDSVIQRATMHAWRVVGPEACTFAGILIAMAE